MAKTIATLAAGRESPSHVCWRRVAIVFLAALALRAGIVFLRTDSLNDDPDGYRAIAANLVEHGVYARSPDEGGPNELQPTAFRPPLYVLLLAAISPGGPAPAWAVGVLHAALGAAAAAMLYVLAVNWDLGRASWLAAALFICDPLLLAQSTEVMTETLAAFLVIAALFAATQHRRHSTLVMAMIFGAMLSLAALCRPTFLPWMAILLVLEIVFHTRDRAAIKNMVCLLVAAILVLAPWVVRNLVVFGRPIAGTTHGGYTLWLGNSPEFYQHLRATGGSPVYDAESVNRRWRKSADELDEDRRRRDAALAAIKSQPETFAWASALRIGWLWTPLPHKTQAKETQFERIVRLAICGWYVGVYALAAIGVFRLRGRLLRAPWFWAVSLCLVFTAVHTVYWTNMRMRAPLVPVICLVAAAAISARGASNTSPQHKQGTNRS